MEQKLFNLKFFHVKKILCLFIIWNLSCKKLVEVNGPVTGVSSANVYSNDATAIAVLTGLYTNMSSFFLQGISSMSLFPGLSSDELTLYNGVTNSNYVAYYKNSLSSLNTGTTDFWTIIYPSIFVVNSAIEGMDNSSQLTPNVRKQLLGEAKFMRAFFYFYLVNLYGDVPLILNTDYTINATYIRSPKKSVYQQIISDLKEAKNLLGSDYVDATTMNVTNQRVRPNRWVASALLARTYLYTGDWSNAESQSDSIINNTMFKLTYDLNDVFLANSSEAIWQLQPVNAGQNTQDAVVFILPSSGPDAYSWPVYLSSRLVSSFEVGDQRRSKWVNSVTIDTVTYYYPYKYKVNLVDAPVTEYEIIFRLGEQFLIRAEARAKQGNVVGAIDDLNIVRVRAGLSGTPASTQDQLLAAIKHERQVELFTEWGHRWLDLKRTGDVDAVMSIVTPQKGGVWESNWQLYPVILSDIQADPRLIQNPGY